MKEVERLVNTGKNALNSGNSDSALNLFEQADSKMPQDEKNFSSKKYAEMADSLHGKATSSKNVEQNKKLEKNAENYIVKSIADDDKVAKNHYLYSNIADEQKKEDIAIRELEKALSLDRDNYEYNYELGKKYYLKKEYKKAKECFERSTKIRPTSDVAFYNLGVTNRKLGLEKDAEKALTSAVGIRPTYTKAFIELARVAKVEKNLNASISYYSRAIASDASNIIALKEMAQVYAELGKNQSAEQYFLQAISKGDTDALTFYNLATVQIDLKKNEQALRNAKHALDLNKDDYRFFYTYALALENNGRKAEAINAYSSSFAKNEKFAKARINMGRIYLEDGDLEKAEENLRVAYSLEPRNFEANTNLGKLYGLKEDYSKSIFHYSESVKIQPKNVNAHKNLALSYTSANEKLKAIDEYKNIIAIEKNSWDSYYEMGRLYLSLQENDNAKAIWMELLQQKPNYPKKDDMLKVISSL